MSDKKTGIVDKFAKIARDNSEKWKILNLKKYSYYRNYAVIDSA